MSGQSVTQTLIQSTPQPDGTEMRMFLAQSSGYWIVELQRYGRREDGSMVPVGMPREWIDTDKDQVYQQVLAAFQEAEQR